MPPKQNKNPKIPKNGPKLAEVLPEGTFFTDFQKQEWTLGKVIGSGGFGLIYLATAGHVKCDDSTAEYVMKLEPSESGPLFTENAFYSRIAKPDLMKTWVTQKRLSYLGIPRAVSCGKHEYNSSKYRFMIMDRFGTDLQKCFEKNGKRFSRKCVHQIAISLLNSLEFIHEHGYVHADIKASNLLLGYKKSNLNQIYLVDFGLAAKYNLGSDHNTYVEDPARAHDGTIEFTSIDAHKGVKPSRRGDLQILGYCLLQWLCGELPWEKKLNNKDFVKNEKIRYAADLAGLMQACFQDSNYPEEIFHYFNYVLKLGYDEKPNYDIIKKFFLDSAKKLKIQIDGKLDVDKAVSPQKRGTSSKRSLAELNGYNGLEKSPRKSLSPLKKSKASPKTPKNKNSKASIKSPPKTSSAKKPKLASVPSKMKSSTSRLKNEASKENIIYPVFCTPPPTNSLPQSSTKVSNSKEKLKKIPAKRKITSSTGTQTSPGLKGLPRSRIKRKTPS